MPRKPTRSATEVIKAVRAHNTPEQRLDYMEEQLTRFVQWHEDLGDSVVDLQGKVTGISARVGVLEHAVGEVKEELTNLSSQLRTAASESHDMLRSINNCLVGTEHMGVKRPGLCDDVKDLKDLVSTSNERLSSLERTRATLIWAGSCISTALTVVGVWAWSHTGQILTTVGNIYGNSKTEVRQPHETGNGQ